MNIETWEGDDEEVDGETADAVRCHGVGDEWNGPLDCIDNLNIGKTNT